MMRLIRSYIHDTRAAVSMETLIVFPFLIWAWIGTFAFFDAYRVYNSSIKATFTVADLLSRQTETVTPADIDGMSLMLEAMIRDANGAEIRVTQILREVDGDYSVDWSYGTGTQARLFTANLAEIDSMLPDMANGERVVLVESFIDYDPGFNIGINDISFDNFTLTRPRYAGQVPFDDGTDNTPQS